MRAIKEKTDGAGSVFAFSSASNLLGPNTNGLDIEVTVKMVALPTALVHLYEKDTNPLLEYRITNTMLATRRLKLISSIEGYSATAVDTVEAEQNIPLTVRQLPTLFPDRLDAISELTRATINVQIQDLDKATELHKTVPIWLLAKTSVPLEMTDPATGEMNDLTRYLGAFVTPNVEPIMAFLRRAVDKIPSKRFVGYQLNEVEVTAQVRAIYEALSLSGINYVNSIITFTPDSSTFNQRVRLPQETLTHGIANCVDGTLLMASLLEAISLNPAIVIVPGHAFLGWQKWRDKDEWQYLETTMFATGSFDEACEAAQETVKEWRAADGGKGTLLKQRALKELRAGGITPRQ